MCRGSCLRRNDGFRWASGMGVVGERGALDSSRGIGMGRGEGMEGPGRCLCMMTATPVPILGVRPWGRVASATTLRQPHTSEGMWTKREIVSRWGSLDHRKCSTIPRDGSGDPRPPFVNRSLPMVTTVESLPHTSERMWTRCEKLSLWGSPVHRKCSTMRRNGSVDS